MSHPDKRSAKDQQDPYSRATRLSHMGLALAVVLQLATSQVMHGPSRGGAMLVLHEISGFVALGFALLLWLVVLFRRGGTPLARLLPWGSGQALAALWSDSLRHLKALLRFRLPEFVEDAPLPSAVHGLGLLLMSVMALSGSVWFVTWLEGTQRGGLGSFAMQMHHLFANLVWVYLIGHAGLGLLHHLLGEASLGRMWSLRGDRSA